VTSATVTGIFGAATLLGAVATLVATALTEDPAARHLASMRAGCTTSSAGLVGGSLVGLASGFTLAAASVALVLSVHAVWLAMQEPDSLRSHLDRLAAGGEDAWRVGFERPFWHYVRIRGRSPTR
jgi:hypothetical protein